METVEERKDEAAEQRQTAPAAEKELAQIPPPTPQRPMTEILELLTKGEDKQLAMAYARDVVQQEVARAVFDQDWRLAKVFAMSNLFGDIKGASEMQAISQAMVKIQLGRSWHLEPADAMQFLYFTNGRPAVMNELFAAKLRDAGYDWDTEFEYDTRKCTGCTLYPKRWNPKTSQFEPMTTLRRNKATGEVTEVRLAVSFTKADADTAMIWEKGKQVKLSDKWNFQSWPEDMYFWRAVARFRRRHVANVLSGVLLRDEAEELPPATAAKEIMRTSVDLAQFKPSGEPNRGHDATTATDPEIERLRVEEARLVEQKKATGLKPIRDPDYWMHHPDC